MTTHGSKTGEGQGLNGCRNFDELEYRHLTCLRRLLAAKSCSRRSRWLQGASAARGAARSNKTAAAWMHVRPAGAARWRGC